MVLVDLVDENDTIVGQATEEDAHKNKLLHRIVAIFIINDKGEMLLQERADGRLDNSCAGHVEHGETYEETAKRELKEELGVENLTLHPIITKPLIKDRSRFNQRGNNHIYMLYWAEGVYKELNKDEVKAVHWVNLKDIYNDVLSNWENNKYTDGFKITLEKYLQLKGEV